MKNIKIALSIHEEFLQFKDGVWFDVSLTTQNGKYTNTKEVYFGRPLNQMFDDGVARFNVYVRVKVGNVELMKCKAGIVTGVNKTSDLSFKKNAIKIGI